MADGPRLDAPRPDHQPSRVATYAEAGVNIDAGEQAVALMRPALAGTPALLNRFGSFGAAVASPGSDNLLVSSADGVGTKLCLARTDQECAGIGRDLVHHCIDDILTSGARPLFFLDYLAFARLDPARAAALVRGMSTACTAHGCALIGGETAELPDLYREGAFDVAGFIVGSVRRDRLLTGAEIQAGDALLGLPSAGLHTNGYSLARRLLDNRLDETRPALGAATIREVLLQEHRCYLDEIGPLLDRGLVRGIAHITGGGLPGNAPRMLPDGLSACFDAESWPLPPIFSLLAGYGLERREMYRAFNMGIGMVVACAEPDVGEILGIVPNAMIIGRVDVDRGGGRVTGLW